VGPYRVQKPTELVEQFMETHFQTGVLLLLIAAVVAMLTRRLSLPYSVGLVAAGIVLAILPFAPQVILTKGLLFTALLPPLLFEAAFYIQWDQLRRKAVAPSAIRVTPNIH
jgi:NhaP-type Na+/H+ or K+/H+ antiporter